MKATIIDGSAPGSDVLELAISELTRILDGMGWEVKKLVPSEHEFRYCIGCFGCWIANPGECVFDDYGREVGKGLIQSDLTVLASPVTFGGFSSHIKKGMDKFLPTIMPFFETVNKEIHHVKRYPKVPNLMSLGYLDEPDEALEKTFRTLLFRIHLNLQCDHYSTAFSYGADAPEDVTARIEAALAEAGVDA